MSSGNLLGISVLELRTDGRPLTTGLASARAQADRAGAQIQTTMDRRMASMGRSMGKVGSTLTRNVTVPILGIVAASADLATKFQQAMEMIHTQAGAPQKEVGALTDKVLALAKTVPQGPVALAEALFRIESVGIRGSKAMDALKASADLAAVGNANLDDTTKALVQTYFTGIKGIGSFKDVVAELNATVGAGDMHLNDLVDALGQGILPAAKLAGLSLKDVLGAVAVFGDETKNVAGWTAQFATALHFLTTPTTKASTALNSMGLSTDQLANDMHKPNGLLVALQDLRTHLDKLPGGANGVKAEQTLGGILPGGRGRVLLVLLNQLDRYQQKLGQIQTTTNQFSGDVAKTQQTAANQLHVAWSTVESDLIDVGDKVLPFILNRAKEVAGFVDKVITDFTRLPKGVQDAIVTGGLVVAGIGPALKIAGIFTSGIGHLVTAAKIAERLATTPLGKGFAGTVSGRAGPLGQTVGTMEVGTLIAKTMVGGAGIPMGAGGVSAAERTALAPGESRTASGIILPAGASTGAVTAVEKEAAASRLTLGRVAAVATPLLLAANGLREAISGHGGGLQGAVDRFIKGMTLGLIPGSAFAKGSPLTASTSVHGFSSRAEQHAFASILDAPKIGSATDKLGALIAKIRALPPDLAKVSPEALVKLKAEAEKLARDPSLAKYRSTLLAVLSGLSRVADNAEGQGRKIARGLEKGWATTRFKSEPIMLQQLQAKIKNLPPQMQAGAIQSVLAYAKGLQAKGQLPAGAWQLMLAQINRLFPGWAKSLGAAGALSAVTFAKAMDLSAAERNTNATLKKISHDFPQVSQAMDKTKGDVVDKAAAAIKALRGIDTTGSAPMTAAVIADMARVRKATQTNLSKMVAVSRSSANDMRQAIEQGSVLAAQAAETNFERVASAVGRAMNSGLISAQQGSKLIGQALNAELVAFGAKPIPIAGFTASQLLDWRKTFLQGSTSSAPGPGHRARGGMVEWGAQGQAGRDSIPVNFGGQPVVVAPGETGMVATRHQRPVMEAWAREHGYMGLNDFFQRNNRPNYMASGGLVTASDYGGPTDPGTGSVGYHGDNLYQKPDTYAELNMGTALGGLPYMAPLNVTYHGKTARLFKRDIGAGGPGLNGHVRAIDLWFQAAQALGFPVPGLGDVLVNAGKGVNVTIAGGGAAASQITAPKVTGTGTVADIVRGALGLEAKAANSYATAHMPTANVGVSAMAMAGLPSGVSVFDGHPVDKWIIPILQWAASHGWGGTVTSGYRTPAEQMAAATAYGLQHYGPGGPLASNHTKTSYPGGAVDVTDAAGLAAVLAGYPGRPNLVWGGPVMGDEVHFSATGHSRGGLIGRLMAGGGLVGKHGKPNPLRSEQATDALAVMNRLWRAARKYYPGARATLPPTRFPGDEPFVGDVFSPDHPSRKNRYILWPDFMTHLLLGQPGGADPTGGRKARNGGLETLIHEWAHQFQADSVTTFPAMWEPEGGAQAFAREFAPRIARAAGFKNFALESPGDDVYYGFVQRVRKQLGEQWIRKGQFGAGALTNAGDISGHHPGRKHDRLSLSPGNVTDPFGRPSTLHGRHAKHGHIDPRFPHKRRRPPQHKTQHGTVGSDRPAILPLSLATPRIQKAMGLVNSLIGPDGTEGEAGRLKELYQNADQWFQFRHPNLNYVVTQDEFGNPVTPYIDWELGPDGTPTPDINSPHAVNASLGELMELFNWQSRIVGDEQRATNMISPLTRWIVAAIRKRKTHVERLKAKIRRNKRLIEAKQRKITENLRKSSKLQHDITGAQRVLQSGNVSPARAVRLRADIASWQGQSARLAVENIQLGGQGNKVGTGGEIGRLMDENRKLGGSPTDVGTAGQIGMLGKEIGQLGASEQTLASDKSTLLGLSGVGGDLETQKFNLATLRDQISQLSPTALRKQLGIAQEQAGPSSSDQALIADLEQQLQTAAQTIAVENVELKVLGTPISLGNLPAFGGSFATGGVVPGVLGEPRTIIAHGGETVTPPGQGSNVRVRVEDHRVRVWVDDVEQIVDKRLRTVSRNAGRGLPGRGGGLTVGRT